MQPLPWDARYYVAQKVKYFSRRKAWPINSGFYGATNCPSTGATPLAELTLLVLQACAAASSYLIQGGLLRWHRHLMYWARKTRKW